MELGIPGIEDVHPVGRGGSALVYRGWQSNLERTVAIKVLKESWDAKSKERFDRERRAMGRLSEDIGIVPIYEADETPGGDPYFIMPYYENGSLQARIDTFGAVPWEEAVTLIDAVGETLSKAHQAEVIHRDIKPANLLINKAGRPMVGDFGIARITSDLSAANTQSAYFTPAFSPPELFSAGGISSPTIDVYGMGATLWSLLSGAPPFLRSGENVSSVVLLTRVMNEPVGDLRSVVPNVICEVIERSMAKEASDRPQSVADFLIELRAAVKIAKSKTVDGRRSSTQKFAEMDVSGPEPVGSEPVGPPPVPDVPSRAGLGLQPSWEISSGGGTGPSSAIAAIKEAGQSSDSQDGRLTDRMGWRWAAVAASLLVIIGLSAVLLTVSSDSDEASANDGGSDGSLSAEEKPAVVSSVGSVDDDPEQIPEMALEDIPEVLPIEEAASEESEIRILPENFASVRRRAYAGTGAGSILRLKTEVAELSSTSAVAVVHTEQCTSARFAGLDGLFSTEQWPEVTNCSTSHKHSLSGLTPGRKYQVSVTVIGDRSSSVRVWIEFETPEEDAEALTITDLRFNKQAQDLVGLSFKTSRCAIVQISGPAGYLDTEGWPVSTADNCEKEHFLDVGGLEGNTVFDFLITAIDEDQRWVKNGISLQSSAAEGEPVNIVKTWSQNLSDTAVGVYFETDICGSPTFLVNGSKITNIPGCETEHEYIVSLDEGEAAYEVEIIARSEAGQSEPEIISFESP